jgi:hypothetical protein
MAGIALLSADAFVNNFSVEWIFIDIHRLFCEQLDPKPPTGGNFNDVYTFLVDTTFLEMLANHS